MRSSLCVSKILGKVTKKHDNIEGIVSFFLPIAVKYKITLRQTGNHSMFNRNLRLVDTVEE